MVATMPRIDPAPASQHRAVRPAGRRVIGVGIRQVRRDAAALRWAMFDARPEQDVVEVLHAVERVSGAASSGWDEIAAAVAVASRQRPGVAVIGAPTAGSAEQVLQAESDQLAMLVLGEDDPAAPHRRIAAHLHRTAQCPVVCVPPGAEIVDRLPVTVIAADLDQCDAAMEFAAQYAERHGAALRVETDENGLRQLPLSSSLIVVDRGAIARLRRALSGATCPVAVIPDRWLGRHG